MNATVQVANIPSILRGPGGLLSGLADARSRTDELFQIVRAEALYDRPISERHRIIFYLGHLEAFDWNLLGRYGFQLPAFDPALDRLFAFGIDPVDGGLPTDSPEDWPTLPQVAAYNQRVRAALEERLVAALNGDTSKPSHEIQRLVQVAIEHRLMHIETLAYMLHQLQFDRKCPPQELPSSVVSPVTQRMIDIPAGVATLGLPRRTDGPFGWDNEFDEHQVAVPGFRIDQCMVSNGDYLEFLFDSGYQDRSLWDVADWNWLQSSGISHPIFWTMRDERWFLRLMFREVELPLDWPVYVSHAEAAAYARWAGKQLPTEAEWHRAAYGTLEGTGEGTERAYPWGDEAPDATRGNFDLSSWNPAPVNAFPRGASAFGVSGLLGNGWEWTSTHFGPFAGFEAFPFYKGYSADFFDKQHYVMKGGSARTAACFLRRSFRNWFQPHYQFAYAGFRCVEH